MNLKNLHFFEHHFSEAEMNAEEIFSRVAETISSCYNNPFPAKTAIYLFTPDAGVHHSVGLWKNALEHGPDFANPKNFPWTLASCPAGFLARNLNAFGPNITLLGGIENMSQIEELIQLHVAQDLIQVAIVVYLKNNFNSKMPFKGFCKGVVISPGDDAIIYIRSRELQEFFNKLQQ